MASILLIYFSSYYLLLPKIILYRSVFKRTYQYKLKNNTATKNIFDILKKEKMLPTNIAAEKLKISRSTLYRLIEEGQLKVVRVSKRNIRVLESSLQNYLKSLNPDLG